MSFRKFPWCQSCHCRSRSLVISRNRPGPWRMAACELGSQAPDVGGWLGERHGCSPCWHKQLVMPHQSGPSGSPPLCGSWEVASSRCVQCRSPTCRGTCTPDASPMKQSGQKTNQWPLIIIRSINLIQIKGIEGISGTTDTF